VPWLKEGWEALIIKDTLADWKPMKGIPYEFTNVAELGETPPISLAAALSTPSKGRKRT